MMWFDPRPGFIRWFFVLYVLVCAGGSYMYVWCEFITPRWYDGRLCRRVGLLVPNGQLDALEGS